jgi:hypothetical protein
MQGYFISRPLDAAALKRFLEDFHGDYNHGFGMDLSYRARTAEA